MLLVMIIVLGVVTAYHLHIHGEDSLSVVWVLVVVAACFLVVNGSEAVLL